jgi:hypothetical protein
VIADLERNRNDTRLARAILAQFQFTQVLHTPMAGPRFLNPVPSLCSPRLRQFISFSFSERSRT